MIEINEEKVFYGESIVYLSFLSKEEFLKTQEIPTTVHACPINNNKILATVNQRGVDIIGGHIEGNETPEEALKRECMEEGYIIPLEFEIIGAIKVDNRDNDNPKYPKIGYQLFYVIKKYEELEFKSEFESIKRSLLTKKDFSNSHHNWLGVHAHLLEVATKDFKNKNILKP